MFGWLKKKEDGPFMEHPTGKFPSAVDAMEDSIRRLRKLPKWDKWIAFNAQGEGAEPESYEFYEVRLLRDQLDVGAKPLDVAEMIASAQASSYSIVADGPRYSIASASPRELAQIFDAIFRKHFGLRPFADEHNDYAVGAEWEGAE